jgi:tRNA modification GTPase
MNPSDTIAAVATPPGNGGLAVLRISGPAAFAVADACFHPGGANSPKPSSAPSHTVHYGHVRNGDTFVDEVLLSVFRRPRSFTGEDTVEIGCHGGSLVTRQVLHAVLSAGARHAEPGEFTRRAFLNGRLDLTQAEAVADLIHARTELAATAANAQLAGHLARQIDRLRDDLMGVLTHVEAHLDFPDEDIRPETNRQLLDRLDHAEAFCGRLLRTAREGRLLRSGARAALVGLPNAGKSSLLNLLLGHDRAIVSPVAGTTRDTIEEAADIGGYPVVFVDTAGLRHAHDAIEAEGIRRSGEAARLADLLLEVVDLSAPPPTTLPFDVEGIPPNRRLRVGNKCDLPRDPGWDNAAETPVLRISCQTGEGIPELREALRQQLLSGDESVESAGIAINARHQDALRRTTDAVARARTALASQIALDLVALDLRIAVGAIGEIVGKTTTEDLLDRIFSTFCLGK